MSKPPQIVTRPDQIGAIRSSVGRSRSRSTRIPMDEPPSAAMPGTVNDHAAIIHEVARALGQSATLSDAAPKMLAAVCDALGWEYGALWEVDRPGTALRFVGSRGDDSHRFTEFVDLSRKTALPRGVGLPGRVWASGRPAGIPDV